MTEPIHEQISSFLDGELPAAESELLLKRLERDPQLRNTVGRYALIGEALRSTEAGGPTRDFAARVSRAIEQEGSSGKVLRPVASWLKPVAGGAIAAGVAAVALVSLRVGPQTNTDGNLAVAAPGISVESRSAPVVAVTESPTRDALPSDTVPVGGGNFPAPPIQITGGGRLANFVVAHSEYSTPLVRRNVLTSLLAEEAIDQNNGPNSDDVDPAVADSPQNAAQSAASKKNGQPMSSPKESNTRGLATR